jgi:hypothetical protein
VFFAPTITEKISSAVMFVNVSWLSRWREPPAQAARDAFVAFLTKELGTDNIDRAKTYMEDALRMTVHLVMSTPEYQIV